MNCEQNEKTGDGLKVCGSQFKKSVLAVALSGRVSVLRLSAMILLAAVFAVFCVSYALEINDKLVFMWSGRHAAVLFFMLERIVWQTALIGGGAMLIVRAVRNGSTASAWCSVVGMMKLGAAVFIAVRASGAIGIGVCDHFPCTVAPVGWLMGWRPFQAIVIILLLGLIPLSLVALELCLKQIMTVKPIWMRIVLILAILSGVFLGMGVSSRFLHNDVGCRKSFEEEDEEDPDDDNGYRLTTDEPGEVRG